MIKQNQRIRMTITKYRTQFRFCFTKYHNANLYIATACLEEMYIDSYNRRQIIKMEYDKIGE